MHSHDHLCAIVRKLPEDYDVWPEGTVAHDGQPDRSCGCAFAIPLHGDWVVCANPASHRCGLLTFEHQGCLHFRAGEGTS